MLKKMMVTFLFIISMIGFSNPARAAAPSFPLDETTWKVGGNFTTSIKFPNFVELTVKMPKLETFWSTFGIGEVFYFAEDGTFQDLILALLPLLAGDTEVPLPTWTQTGSNFTVDITELSTVLAEGLQGMLGDLATVDGTPSKPPVFSGKVASNGSSISGKVAISYNLSIQLGDGSPLNGTLSVTMSFKGTYVPPEEAAAMKSSLQSKTRNGKPIEMLRSIKLAISDIISLIPRKGVPQKSRVK